MKIVINKCYGGFGLSKAAIDLYCERKQIDPGMWKETWGFYDQFHDREIERYDPLLVEIVEQLGDKANGKCAELAIVEVPDGIKWLLEEYDGKEWIAEVHRTWS